MTPRPSVVLATVLLAISASAQDKSPKPTLALVGGR
jgi:hypothetical protein